jgi:hypothetical protein
LYSSTEKRQALSQQRDPEDKLCPDCREQNAPDEDDNDGDDADLGLGIL